MSTQDSFVDSATDSVATRVDPSAVFTAGSHSRLDRLTGEWTIFAPARESRPNDFQVHLGMSAASTDCPFCRGHEYQTPPAVWSGRIRRGGADPTMPQDAAVTQRDHGWSVRVVPNKFPAVGGHAADASTQVHEGVSPHYLADASRATSSRLSTPLASMGLEGAHEVIIESPDHVESFSEMDVEAVQMVFHAYKQRLSHWSTRHGIQYISLFKNVGRDAGASLLHSHSQLIAMNQIPMQVVAAIERGRRHHARTGCCLQCDLIRQEQRDRVRVVAVTDHLIAYCPFASRFPRAIRVTTRQHADRFEGLSDAIVAEVAALVRRLTTWLQRIHPGVAYNCILATRPPGCFDDELAFHWSFMIIPRTSHIAGFELASGTYINGVLPETAAAAYRSHAQAENPRSL